MCRRLRSPHCSVSRGGLRVVLSGVCGGCARLCSMNGKTSASENPVSLLCGLGKKQRRQDVSEMKLFPDVFSCQDTSQGSS